MTYVWHFTDLTKTVYVTGQWFLLRHIVGTVVFIAAFFLQFETHKAFAALRKKGIYVAHIFFCP